ncbi:site-specific DNA-methyltransferase (adenine-specific) [Ktedonobacter sp. SOSP1-85]|uniref:DNA adenine methylase n=1 Tax=Ktedonobacter sp. SOSP1-85 TaxID=2778367 RepID=UPI00191575C2|nr:Dam family site-specific DNA-(adenine-N6)-methyltransferase [Ktedonobacter sp. SOSP1-85]GHO76972.1 site-specific DNA-methyltransferase (adenine-specific) [Ktedonobacter sp. SOSP1-85]
MNTAPILFKWPGGKRALIKHINPLIPKTFNRYYEPFVGGGALFFTLSPFEAILSDSNPELINCYQQVKDHPDLVIAALSTMQNTKEDYYRVRENIPKDNIAKAARLIYLMKLSFNGLHRVNKDGKFNVPYGDNMEAQLVEAEKIYAASKLLSLAQLEIGDFEDIANKAQEGDFIYFDPPYTVAHKNNGFVKYNAHIFSWKDQIRLSQLARNLVLRGCRVVISNADHPSIEGLYNDFEMQRVSRSSAIAASQKFRKSITECIFYNKE